MTTRYPGGLIRKTPPTITPPVGGEGGSAPGVWTLEQASYYTKTGTWPLPTLPRKLFTFGYNGVGELGQNNLIDRSSPVQVGTDTIWSQTAGGSVGFFNALKTNGTLWAWGYGTEGALGQGDVVNRSSPVQIGALTTWSQVTAGNRSVIALKTDGTLWGWGSGQYGTLGQNNTDNYSSPVQIGSDTNWSLIAYSSTVGRHMAAIKTDNTLWMWGLNNEGQLGQNDKIWRSSPVQVGALTTWSKVSVGFRHTLALKNDGTLWAWGGADFGELGNNSAILQSSPVQVGALTTWTVPYAVSYYSLAIRSGSLFAWGFNAYGQLGINNVAYRSSPVQVGSDTTWSQIGATNYGALALKTDGTLWSWGSNQNGELGQNNTTFRSSPVQVGSATNWWFVGTGTASALAAITKG